MQAKYTCRLRGREVAVIIDPMNNTYSKGILGASALKYIAALAMLIDHVAWLYLPIDTAAGQLAHTVGRLTMPVMCYFLAEGFYKTKSTAKYAARLFIFALLAQPGFTLAGFGGGNVMFTLLLGLLALWACQLRVHPALSALAVLAAAGLSVFCDWPVFGVLFVLIFGLRRDDARMTRAVRFAAYGVVALASVVFSAWTLGAYWRYSAFQLGTLLAPALLMLYNGERGRGGALSKWFFYVFYPAHLLALGLIHTFS